MIPYCCPACGGLFDYAERLFYEARQVEAGQPGIWRYRHSFGLPEGRGAPVSLGEGNTPLVWAEAFGRQVAFKCEYLNPSGSFKDRGSALLISFLRGWGVKEVVEDSSGNAGASLAAYAARAEMRARVFVPEATAGPKLRQIEAYGAEVVRVSGPRSQAAEAARRAAEQGAVYASHAYLPFNLPGYATIAYEIVEQLGGAPGCVVSPAGQGGLLLGLGRGFEALAAAGVIAKIPLLVGVQARACAPLWALATYGPVGLSLVGEAQTLAEGIRVRYPLRGDTVLQTVERLGGMFLSVEEEAILPGRDQLSRRGFYVEPTSAVVWEALAQLAGRAADPLVVILTGSGLKTSH